jgi:uncharacterized protein (DUF2141 family)
MLKKAVIIVMLLGLLTQIGCAKRGTITGGAKDTLAPVLTTSFPKNYATNFKGNEIELVFDEYVKLKNVTKQLIVSPPMKKTPSILPYSASKTIAIKLYDTLLENTTYSFNFGNSIEDNNEGNKFEQFKYVFSTGKYIDSLVLNAKVKDAYNDKVDNYVSVMLYEINASYSDSIVYKEVPRYLTSTLDSLKLVKLENIKEGKYQLVAMKDVNGNNKFDPKTDKIGFQKEVISIPNDTLYEIELFKEELAFKAVNAVQASGNRITLGYEGNPKDVKIELKKGVEKIPFKVTKLASKDSLNIWFKAQKNDSLAVEVVNGKFKKTFALKVKDQKKDSLSIGNERSDVLHFRNRFAVQSNSFIEKIDASKIKFIRKDSTNVKFTTEHDPYNQKVYFDFEKQPLEKYKITLFPGAIVDFNGKQNDTLDYSFVTKVETDYGNLRVKLENVKRFPVIVELTNPDGKIIASATSDKETALNFDLVEPQLFTLRLIYDDNKNQIWDTGSFLEKRQAEEVIYFPKQIDVRANWDVEQPFDVGK